MKHVSKHKELFADDYHRCCPNKRGLMAPQELRVLNYSRRPSMSKNAKAINE